MFNLETAIKEWKRNFQKQAGFEDGLLADMELHLRDEYEAQRNGGLTDEEAFRVSAEQVGLAELIAAEYGKNVVVARNRRAPLHPARFMPSLAWNYLKIAARKIGRQKVYSFLNIAGLAIGLACFMLLALWVRDEVSWDRFHANSKALYRVQSGLVMQPGAVGPHIKANFPEVANAARLYFDRSRTVSRGEHAFDERAFVYADSSVFEMFTIPFRAGDPATAFAAPNAAVLTESAAWKYFGGESPVGQSLMVENQFQLLITGVVENPRRNSDLQFEVLATFEFLENFLPGQNTAWGSHNFFTYVQLKPGTDYRALIPKIAPVRRIMDDEPTAWLLTLVPLTDIHLYEDGAVRYVTILALVAVFILVIAGCNFINLTTAKSGQRAKEIAVRKVAGAVRSQLLWQFLGEAVFLSFCSLLIALSLVALVFPFFSTLTGREFHLRELLAPGFLAFCLGTALIIGLAAGAYPALLLSSFRPAGLLKSVGSQGPPSRSILRKTLVATQFAISIVLMISMLFIHRQVEFIRHFDLGINKENVIILPAKTPILQSRAAFIDELSTCPGVVSATIASSYPSGKQQVNGADWEGKDPGYDAVWQFVETDSHYLETLGIKLVEGHNFPATPPRRQVEPYFIINQQAAADMKMKNPMGARLTTFGTPGTVIGVVSDYHFKLLHEPVGPLVLLVGPYNLRYLLIQIQPGSGGAHAVLGRIKEVWDRFTPGTPFSYEFLDSNYDLNYQREQRLGLEFRYFTVLGIIISCLGLFGLMASVAEQKRKEIAIRKVLGASLPSLLRQLNREYLVPILLSNLIAWPAAWWFMSRWLGGYAYRTGLSLGIFLAATASTFAIALLTVSGQAIRTARANPVDSLSVE